MILAFLIRLYQLYVPVKYKRHCRLEPHCSAYGLRAAQLHGTWQGGAMAIRRVLSCGALAYVLYYMSNPPKDCCDDAWAAQVGHYEECWPKASTGECKDCTPPDNPNDPCF